MPRGKTEQAEQIIPKLREVKDEIGRGKTVVEVVKKIGATEPANSMGVGLTAFTLTPDT